MTSAFNDRCDAPMTPALVGRARELDLLLRAFQAARDGHGGLVLVSGEAGIGKTSLVQHLVAEAKEQGALVLTGAAYDLSATPPYGPWLELTGQYRPAEGLPELPDVLRQGIGIHDLSSQLDLFEIARDFFIDLADKQTLLLVLEDLHWSDQASLDALRHIARQINGHRILLIVTYRDDEVTRQHPLFQLLPTIVRESGPERIELRALDESGVRRLTEQLVTLGDADRDKLVSYLLQRAEGNPLFTDELIRTLEREGMLQRTDTGWQLEELSDPSVPSLIRQMVDRRMSELSSRSHDALQTAAVIGHVVPLAHWERIAGADTVAVAADEALTARLMTEAGDSQGVVFRHALVREAIYESLSIPLRRRRHCQVADSYSEQPDPDPDIVAYHLLQAGDSRAVEWTMLAGEKAEARLAFPAACDRYNEAVEILQRDAGNEIQLIDLLLRIARMLCLLDPSLSIEYFESALQAAQNADEVSAAAYALFSVGFNRLSLGETRRGLQEMRDGAQAMFDAHERGGSSASALSRALPPVQMVNGGLAVILASFGRFHEAIETAERFLDLDCGEDRFAEDGANTISNFEGYHGLAVALSNLGRPEDGGLAYKLTEDVVQAARHHPSLLIVANSYLLCQHFPYRTNDLRERARLVTTIEDQIKPASGVMDPANTTWGYEFCLLHSGRWSDMHRLIDSKDAPSIVIYWVISMSARARLALYQGDFEGARRILENLLPEGSRTEPEGHPHSLPGYQVRIAAELALEKNELTSAREWMDTHDRWLDWSGAVLGFAEGLLLWAKIHHAEGEDDEAARLACDALGCASRPGQPFVQIAIHRFLGDLCRQRSDLDTAEAHLQTSLELAEACDIPYERALTLLAQAELEIAKDNREEALDLLGEVRRVGTELGARPMLERAGTLAARLTTPRKTDARYGLSARELEVLQLLVEGRSNKEIGDELFISHRTAMQHVSSILRKLDVENRSAVAARAIRENLI